MAVKDRRFRKTEKLIFDAMVRLLNRESLENLQIRDLIMEADINKSTFYLHYQSLDAILSTLEDDLVSRIRASFEPFESPEGIPTEFEKLLAMLKKDRKLAYAVFNSSSRIWNKISDVYNYNSNVSISLSTNKKQFDRSSYQLGVFIDMIFTIVSKWVIEGCKSKPEDVQSYLMYVSSSPIFSGLFEGEVS